MGIIVKNTPVTIPDSWFVVLADGAGQISSVVNAGSRYIANALIQNVQTSVSNNSTANLASGATFTGTGESTLGVNAIQINFKADQNCTIQLQQSNNNVDWDIIDSFSVIANIGEGITIQATASFFRTLVTNNGGSSTTFLRLQCVLCPIADVMPKSLGQKDSSRSVSVVLSSSIAYSASKSSLITANAATDIFTITGSATKTIKITKVFISFESSAVSPTPLDVLFLKRSTANSGGTSTVITNVPLDSNSAVATATVRAYTANPTLGTLVGNVYSQKAKFANNSSDNIYLDLTTPLSQPIILRGTSQVFAINLDVQTLAGSDVNMTIFWTEE